MLKALSRRAAEGSKEWLDLGHDDPEAPPSAAQQRAGFVLFQRSTLERVYPTSRPRAGETIAQIELQASRGEYEPAQVAVDPLRDLKQVTLRVSDLNDAAGNVIPASALVVRMVRFYGLQLAIQVPGKYGVVPKTLEVATPLDIKKGSTRPYWITVHVPSTQTGGTYQGTLTVHHADGQEAVPFSVEVVPTALREPNVIYGTGCLNAFGSIGKMRSDRAETMRRHADVIFRDEREHGMTSISLWSGKDYDEIDGQPYLPDLEVATQLYQKYGFTQPLIYVAGNLFKTNKSDRSASYTEYKSNLAVPMAHKIGAYYTKRFADLKLPGILFDPVEEPSLRTGVRLWDRADVRQRIAGELTRAFKDVGAATALTCTPESIRPIARSVDHWIVSYHRFGPQVYDMARAANAKLSLYANATMMGNGTYRTRFLFGYFVWANHLDGMLPWTYPLQPKRFPTVVDGHGEGGLNVTDGFLGSDGQPIPVIQWELAREGIDDAKYLVTIEALSAQVRAHGDAPSIAAADEADAFLQTLHASIDADPRHYTFEDPITLEPKPDGVWNAHHFEELHQQEVALLEKLLVVA